MIKHYDNLIFSKIVEKNDYSFKNPTFGKSNTDQSYYEPMASMVQNLSKSAAFSSSLHNNAEKSISQIRAESDFLPQNMTHEETQAFIVRQREIADNAIKDVKAQINAIKDDINLNKEIEQKTTDTE